MVMSIFLCFPKPVGNNQWLLLAVVVVVGSGVVAAVFVGVSKTSWE